MAQSSSREILRRYRAGDERAAAEIFDRYLSRLVALARSRMSPALRRRLDPDDVVQSAYRSFFLRAQDGQFNVSNSGDLWRLLSKMTMNKLHRQIEKHTSAKRSIQREETSEASRDSASGAPHLVDAIAVGEKLSIIVDRLSPSEQFVFTSTLQGRNPAEVSIDIGKSERTVRRLLSNARRKVEEYLLDSLPTQAVTVVFPPIPTPLVFSQYTIQRLIGSGGMGKVYRALDNNTGKLVAMKTLHRSKHRDARAVKQLAKEASILQGCQHPNIVPVHGLGSFPGGGLFLIMEYVLGDNLHQRLQSQDVTLASAMNWSIQIGEAIKHAHSKGVVHCDVNPANVLIDEQEQARLTDFGFAHLFTGDKGQGGTSVVGGTEGYVAPEVFLETPTVAADIYSMGVLLENLLESATIQSELRHTTDVRQLLEMCKKCQAPDPKDRFATAAEMVTVLRRIRADRV